MLHSTFSYILYSRLSTATLWYDINPATLVIYILAYARRTSWIFSIEIKKTNKIYVLEEVLDVSLHFKLCFKMDLL